MTRDVTLAVFTLLFTTLLNSASALECDEACNMPGRGLGTWVRIRDCPPFLIALQSKPVPQATLDYLTKSQCGFQDRHPLVCYPTRNSKPTQRPTSPPPAENEATEDVSQHPNLKLLRLDICGPLSEERIIHGEEAALMELPWMALLAYDVGSGYPYLCGGAIINERYVLTAAHCVTDLKNNVRLVSVRLGEHNLTSPKDCQGEEEGEDFTEFCTPTPQDIPIEEVTPHPRFSGKRDYLNDIALVRLSRAADFTHDAVRPICLPIGLAQQTANLTGKTVVISGWGITEYGERSTVLLKVSTPVMTYEECSVAYRAFPSISPVSQICAGGVTNGDSCKVDSGSPLTYFGEIQRRPRAIQHGILSFGYRNCSTPGVPAVYTRIGHYMKWILDTMKP